MNGKGSGLIEGSVTRSQGQKRFTQSLAEACHVFVAQLRCRNTNTHTETKKLAPENCARKVSAFFRLQKSPNKLVSKMPVKEKL